MKILIVGGTGFIGQALVAHCYRQGHQVTILTRDARRRSSSLAGLCWVTTLKGHDEVYDALINLAGERLDRRRWNDRFKKRLVQSRLTTTQMLVDYMARVAVKPACLINASAVGYYGDQGENFCEESVTPKQPMSFAQNLCVHWEAVAGQAESYGVRVCFLRLGVVLDGDGGALAKMLLPFRLGLGAILGTGQQWFSWIHREDVVLAIDFLLNHKMANGPFNLVSPQPVVQRVFAQTLADQLKRPLLMRMPAKMVSAIFGEMGESLLLASTRAVPRALTDLGYVFRYPDICQALRAILVSGDA